MRRINRDLLRLGQVLGLVVAAFGVTVAATAALAARNDSAPQPASQPDSALTTALIQQAWPKVADLLDSETSLPPAMQFVQAHAFTALNKPNESLCALMDLASTENIAAWYAWAQDFQTRYPQHAVAYYLLGDALARRGDLAGAVSTFTAGLQIDSSNPLLLNARGTAYAVQGNRQAAREDLLRVASGDRPLVDAQVGAGALIIDRKGGSSDARSWFDSALGEQQSEDALALYGRALTWVADGDWERANADLEAALESAPCIAPLMATQLTAMQAYMTGGADAAADTQDAESGFALARVIEPFLENPTDRNASALLAYLGPNPQDVSVATSILRSYGTGHPLWAATASQQLSQANTWNVSLQPTLERLSTVPGVAAWRPYPWLEAAPRPIAAPGTMLYAASLQNPYGLTNGLISGQPNAYSLSNLQLVGTLRDAVGTGVTPGGFDANLHQARFDRGDWPAVTYYGLLYPAAADQVLP
jgi:tetratricopeptide (TPR) repeat protein